MDYLQLLRGHGLTTSLAELTRTLDMTRAAKALSQVEDAKRLLAGVTSEEVIRLMYGEHSQAARGIASLGVGQTVAEAMSQHYDETLSKYANTIDQVTRELHARSYLQSLHDQMDGLGTILGKYVSNDFLTKHSSIHASLAVLEDMASLRALAELKNSPFSYLDEHFLSRLWAHLPEGAENDPELQVISDNVKGAIASTDDFNLLPDDTKKFLYFLLFAIFEIIQEIYGNMIWDELTELKNGFQAAETKAEVRTLAQHTNVAIDRDTLRSYRVTTASDLNLREQPSMQGEIIVMLPIGTLVQVIDKSKRSWLYVEVEIDGEIQHGWVSRRYTAMLR